MAGWIKLHRKIQEHWVWADHNYMRWWLTILLNVNHEDKTVPVNYELIVCSAGQSFRSINSWSELFGCSKKTTIKFFRLLESDKMITSQTVGSGNRRKHLLTVVNWKDYQVLETEKSTRRKPENPPKLPPNKNEEEEKNIKLHSENFKFFGDVVKYFDARFFNEKKWLDCYDKLIRIDGYSEGKILAIVKEFRSDGNWWRDEGNFESLLKLRKKDKQGIKYIELFDAKLTHGQKGKNGNREDEFDNNKFKIKSY